ncbi:hypothetical protein B0H14DRAFT_2356094 [Mycena olivaceomarginata]|nr:hypothetical protein B0H14DRAFT_2356094 [Mycena olivaceomarginata]
MMQTSDSTTASDTASTSPLSPFSSFSVPSEPTSDELPDLGAFTTVLRAWNHLQPPPRTFTYQPQHSTSTTSSMEPESDDFRDPSLAGSTVWSQRQIALYLDSLSAATDTTDTGGRSPSTRSPSLGSGSNTEGDTRTLELETVDYELSDLEDLDLDPQPSLGLLDGALSFIAAERARWTAQREADVAANEGAWKHVVEPRRKRRRKRTVRNPKPDDASRDDHIEEEESLAAEDADDSSSSFENTTTTTTTTTRTVPATPARSRKERRRQQALANTSPSGNRVLIHSKSTPQLRALPFAQEPHPHPHYPRVVQLRTLAKKLGKVFPVDKAVLDGLIPADLELQHRMRADDFFVDPRGRPPGANDTLIHVFIDHSNILIGLLTYLRRYPRPPPPAHSSPKLKHLSHAALALVLERGRPITRRVLVTSSPLYQPMDTAERLGYEVRVYARVPDLGDGQDRVGSAGAGGGGGRPQGHNRSLSAGTGGLMGFMQGGGGGNGNGQQNANGGGGVAGEFPTLRNPRWGGGNGNGGGEGTGGGGGRKGRKGHVRRYREQGVDELLQLKLHQALAALDGPPPPGATIVLATGDGNVGQFNDDGFLGPVRTALKKGWRVELYAWEEGLSRAWMREFGEWTKPVAGEATGRFRVVGMEQFATELLEIY